MKCRAEIQAGVCGFSTSVLADAPDDQMVTLTITTHCDKIAQVAAALNDRPIDAHDEIAKGFDGVIMPLVRANLSGCCAGCAVPAGILKAVQVGARVALPRPVAIEMTSES